MVRRLGWLSGCMLVVLILAACGGAGAQTPEARAQSFFTDLGQAMSDPNIADAAKQDEWADKLSKYFIPSEQAKQKDDLKKTLTGLGGGGSSITFENLKVEKVTESGDSAEVKIASGIVTMEMGGQKQVIDLTTEAGKGFGGSGNMQKVDGVWYLAP